MAMGPGQGAHDLEELFRREVSEVYLLLDHISGRPDRALSELDGKIPDPDGDGVEVMSYNDIIKRVSDIKYDYNRENKGKDAAFLLALKDYLNTMAFPAKGMTIAFTTLFSEKDNDKNRFGVAADSFPGLVDPAARFRFWNGVFAWAVLLITALAALALWQATHGAALVAQFNQSKRVDTEAAAKIYAYIDRMRDSRTESLKYDAVSDLKSFCSIPSMYDRHLVSIRIDSELRQNCNDYVYKHAIYCVSISDIGRYSDHWSFTIIRWFLPVRDILVDNECSSGREIRTVPGIIDRVSTTASLAAPIVSKGRQEDAQSISSVLSIMSNYFLPAAFGFVGAAAALARGVQDRVRTFTLAPRDGTLAPIRLILGMVAGICVGLFFSPAAIVGRATDGLGIFTVSASSIAFLAGYGAEAFFRAIDTLIAKIFDPAADKAPQGPSARSPV